MPEWLLRTYAACEPVFRAQGILFPFVAVGIGAFEVFGTPQLLELSKRFEKKGARPSGRSEADYRELPVLQPLNCARCGAATLLRETETACPSCGLHSPMPDDYRQAAVLKAQAAQEIRHASRHWRVVRFLSHPVTGAVFFWLIFLELGLLALMALTSFNYDPDPAFSWSTRSFGTRFGWWWCLVILPLWTLVFINLTQMSKEHRGKGNRRVAGSAPVLEAKDAGAEVAACQDCGGAVAYRAGDFATLCRYCNVVQYRARFVQLARGRAQTAETRAGFSLFKAQQINERFVGDTFALLAVLGVGAVLLTVFLAAT